MKITNLPIELIVEIVFYTITNDLSIDNFKNKPAILSSHPLFLSSLRYFSDEKWKILCNMIINLPNKLEDNWKLTFLKLVKTKDLELLKLTLEGNFGKVRMINIKDKYKDKIIQNNVIRGLFKFKKNLIHLESKNEQMCLLQLLREFSYVRIERESFDYFSKLLDDVLIDYTNNNIKYDSFGVHILRELVNIRDEYCNKFTDRSSINIINL
tara:strand:- start:872 stop:1504 length:633 start_codon:yes stop_codon:yes gene_type:complete